MLQVVGARGAERSELKSSNYDWVDASKSLPRRSGTYDVEMRMLRMDQVIHGIANWDLKSKCWTNMAGLPRRPGWC